MNIIFFLRPVVVSVRFEIRSLGTPCMMAELLNHLHNKCIYSNSSGFLCFEAAEPTRIDAISLYARNQPEGREISLSAVTLIYYLSSGLSTLYIL